MKTSRGRPPRLSETEGTALVAEWEKSGLSQVAFSHARGLSVHQVGYWKRRLAASGEQSSRSMAFAVASAEELRMAPAAETALAGECIELVVDERFRIRTPARNGALEAMLRALEAVRR